jgi:hypothetical protein
LGQKGAKMTTTRTHFTFRVDTWTPDGESIVEHVAGVEEGPGLAMTAQCCTMTKTTAAKRGPDVP